MSETTEPRRETTPQEKLDALAAEAPAEPAPTDNGRAPNGQANGYDHRLDVGRWLTARGRAYRIKDAKASRQRTVYLLAECPFNPAHGADKECSVMQEPSGKMSALCMHDSCQGRGWQDFKAAIGEPDPDHYDPPKRPWKKKDQAAALNPPRPCWRRTAKSRSRRLASTP